MTLHFDPALLVWGRFDGLEPVDPAWAGDVDYWEGFNAAFFAANGLPYDPARDSNVATWVSAPDRASFSDMIAALAPALQAQGRLEGVGMVVLTHWLPDLHLGSSATNFAMHHMQIPDCLGFAISDRGVSAPLFGFDYAARVLASGRCRKVLMLVMDQKHMLYRSAEIAALRPENVAAAFVLDAEDRDAGGLIYRGYIRREVAEPDLPLAIAAMRAELGLPLEAVLIGPADLSARLPGLVPSDPALICAAPFIALHSLPTPPEAALLLTWQYGTLTGLGFARAASAAPVGGHHAA